MQSISLQNCPIKEEKFQSIIDGLTDAIIMLDNDWCFTYSNKKAALLFEATPAYLVGKNIWNEFHEIIDSPLRESCEKAKENQQYIRLELYFPTLGLWLETHIYPTPYDTTIQLREITACKQIEASEHKLALRNATIIDTMCDNFSLVDEGLNIIDVNPAFCNTTGYKKEELLKMSITDLDIKHSLPEIKEHFKKGLKKSKVLIDTKVRKKNGDLMDMEVALAEMYIDGIRYFASFGRDISAFKKAEEALKESNERFELIGNTTQDAIWETNLQTGIRWSNQMYQIMYGLQKNNPVPEFEEWAHRIHPEERLHVTDSYNAAIQSGKNKWLAEYKFKSENKGYISIYDRTYIVYDKNGAPIRIVGSMMDITDVKNAEEMAINEKKLSDSFINSLPGIFYLYDESGQFLRWNKNFETVSGYSSTEIAIMNLIDFYDGDDKEMLSSGIKEVFENGRLELEAYFFTKGKEKIPYYFNGQVIDIDGQKCLIGTGVDITTLKKAEKNLHVMEQEILNQKLQEQKKISRTIINTQERERGYIGRELHDNVNQILAGTRLYLSMAGKSNEGIKQSVAYPLELLDSAINEIRLLTSKHVTPLKFVDLKQLAQNLLDTINKTTSIKTTLTYEVVTKIKDEDLKINIYRILQEQLNNITKHAAASNVTISIKAHNGIIHIITKDDGRGFILGQKREGIGISNMINRIDSFNGEMSLKTSPGDGCLITIQIPY